MATRPAIGQRGRLAILVAYLVGLFVASRIALGTWIPPTTQRGIWFYAALAALLLGNLLVTPFFTKPADAISYAVAAAIALLAANVLGSTAPRGFEFFIWSAAMLYVLVVLAVAILAIGFKDSPRPFARKVATSSLLLAYVAGSPRWVFSVVFLFALITYHRTVPREYITIGIAWALFVGLRPLETLAGLGQRWRNVWAPKGNLDRLGEVVGHETPGVILIREELGSSAAMGDLVLARTESGRPGLAIALDHVGFAEGCWLRAVELVGAEVNHEVLGDAQAARGLVDGAVFRATQDIIQDDARARADDARQRLLGLVAPNTDVGQLQVELVRSDLDVREGSLVEVEIKRQPVLYQVITGLTKEEVLQEKNTRGFVRAQAKKVGFWNSERRSFDPVPWLPQPNQAVLLTRPERETETKGAIGHFPGTAYPVCIDPDLLVTHSAAILGILGVGKSFLGLELVERMIDAGIKVVCLDLTNQYAEELAQFLDAERDQTILEELAKLGPPGKTRFSKNIEEGGSVREFSAKIGEQLTDFLDPADGRRLRILNPSQFEVWRQDSKPYQDVASMATLTPTEITRIITEAVLKVLQDQGVTGQARCCIVYEEAHSLIPEWNAVASDGDRTATNGTAKAILQGRKYGLGCLVITQRTANVTKSILNQCNTVFGLRVFDVTGMEFLKNYIGEDYAAVLSTLDDRHAVVFGRASSCRDPVLTRLNDRTGFLEAFRKQEPPASQAAGAGASPAEATGADAAAEP